MSVVEKGRTTPGMDPLSDDRLPAWQKELIQKKRAMNRPFPSVIPPTGTTTSNGDYSGAFHPNAAATTNAIHAPVNPAPRNNKLNNESDGNRAWMSKEKNWNGIRQQVHNFHPTKSNENAAEKLSEPSATQAQQLTWGLNRQQGNFEPLYFTFNHAVKMGEDKGNVITNNNNTPNVFNDIGNSADSNRMVTNGFAINGIDDQAYNSEDDEEYEYGPGIVNRLRSKFNNLTMKERALTSPTSALLSPVRRVASLEHLLDTTDDVASHYRTSPTQRYTQRSVTLPNRSSTELLKRARSMETLTIDRSQGSGSTMFGPKSPFRMFSREDGASPLSPVNDKVIIIEQPKPPKTNGTMPLQETGNTKQFPTVRVGQDLAWKNCSNVTLIDEELPKPDTVRTKKKIFETSNEDHENQSTSPKTIILRPPKVAPPPKPPGLKPGPKPSSVKPLPPTQPPSKSVFEFLKKKESAEKNEEMSSVALPPTVVTPPQRAPSPTTTPTTFVEQVQTSAAIVGETMKSSAKSDSQPQPINLPQHPNFCEQNGVDIPKTKKVWPVKPLVQNSATCMQNDDSESISKPPVVKPQGANEGNFVIYKFVGNDKVKAHVTNKQSPNYLRPLPPEHGNSNGTSFEEEVIDEEDFAIDDLLSKPAHVDFVGDNVIVGRSALMKTRNKKVNLLFCLLIV